MREVIRNFSTIIVCRYHLWEAAVVVNDDHLKVGNLHSTGSFASDGVAKERSLFFPLWADMSLVPAGGEELLFKFSMYDHKYTLKST